MTRNFEEVKLALARSSCLLSRSILPWKRLELICSFWSFSLLMSLLTFVISRLRCSIAVSSCIVCSVVCFRFCFRFAICRESLP